MNVKVTSHISQYDGQRIHTVELSEASIISTVAFQDTGASVTIHAHSLDEIRAAMQDGLAQVETLIESLICKRCGEQREVIRGGICGSCADDLRAGAQAAEAEQQFEAMQKAATDGA